LVRSGNVFAREAALLELERGGASDTNVLLELLSDPRLLGWHQDVIGALVRKRAEVPLAGLLNEETEYWRRSCRTLHPGWWNSAQSSDIETARDHYTRAHALLSAIHERNRSEATPAAREFGNAWRKCLAPEKPQSSDQISKILELLSGPELRNDKRQK
jgi:hypothetical protein